MSWSPSPLRVSLEAIYPLTVVDGKQLYHALPNVCNIMISLNLLKRKNPILVLPLLGQFLRTHHEADFQQRKAVWTWIYIATYNVGIMNKIFHCTLNHKAQIERWSVFSQEKKKSMLEHLRTGEFGPTIREELAFWEPNTLFGNEGSGQFRKHVDEATTIVWKTVYQWLERIAAKYDLTRREFEYYCTIQTPRGRVFYPYHVLSRPQAQKHWGWHTLFAVARGMLVTMQTACNRHAEAAGLGENQMNPLRLIYWWTHHLCQKIQGIKRERPGLPTWGIPVVPWSGNVFKASLCKNQDHGIAMIFGLEPFKGTEFDPVKHFDLARCTITIDTKATNWSMSNYPSESWGLIPQMLSMVPLCHPFWQVHDSLGLEPWVGRWRPDTQPQPPKRTSTVEIPLMPIDHWFDNSTSHIFRCMECAVEFQSAGLLAAARNFGVTPTGFDSTSTPSISTYGGTSANGKVAGKPLP
ncbi:hypothetical protein C7999DRAFT_45057 [Corynascus novoguineensis]|uniref:Uncharacterized protein n=1 Tax=Corynascus novoguineensis TaxID=1126955 RepID=A0AAN7CL39_9PEZI|nr:hypothetical protein C7999DRAFT_45057 [Corynascus novoguineensis]